MIPIPFAALPWGWSVADVAIAIVFTAAIVALVYVALRKFGVAIPEWVIQCFWIVVCAFVVTLCIKIVASM